MMAGGETPYGHAHSPLPRPPILPGEPGMHHRIRRSRRRRAARSSRFLPRRGRRQRETKNIDRLVITAHFDTRRRIMVTLDDQQDALSSGRPGAFMTVMNAPGLTLRSLVRRLVLAHDVGADPAALGDLQSPLPGPGPHRTPVDR